MVVVSCESTFENIEININDMNIFFATAKGNARRNDLSDFHDIRTNGKIAIRLDEDAISYFKGISDKVGIPYQSLINLYLRYCAATHRQLNLQWK